MKPSKSKKIRKIYLAVFCCDDHPHSYFSSKRKCLDYISFHNDECYYENRLYMSTDYLDNYIDLED